MSLEDSCLVAHMFYGSIKQVLSIRTPRFETGDSDFMDVITLDPGIRQTFSSFYLKFDYSLERKIVLYFFL